MMHGQKSIKLIYNNQKKCTIVVHTVTLTN